MSRARPFRLVRRRARAVLLAAIVALPAPAGALPRGAPAAYMPPVDAPISDPFREPATRYGPGNRGIEYDTSPGDHVSAIGDGEVIFAGSVAGARHVTVLHPDGLRSSYSLLASISVSRGERVTQGQPVGVAGERFHLGVRDPDDRYLDPALLFGGRVVVRLVPLDSSAVVLADERAALSGAVGSGGGGGGSGGGWGNGWRDAARDDAAAVLRWLGGHVVSAVDPSRATRRAVSGIAALVAAPARQLRAVVRAADALLGPAPPCTPANLEPAPPAGRRIAVLVGGLGSTSTDAAIDGVDAAALGYAPEDVVRFSYRGGRVPDGTDSMPSIDARAYGPADTQQPVSSSAVQLRALLEQVVAAAPGATVDLIAHSQGGVVARLGLEGVRESDPVARALGLVVTLGSPHGGAPLADLVAAGGGLALGDAALEVLMSVLLGLDPDGASIDDLVTPGAPVQAPDVGRWLAIGGRGDAIVPAANARLPGATNVTVGVAGPADHDRLPAADAVTREVRLALAGLPPACESPTSRGADALVGGLIESTERALVDLVAAFAG